MRVLVVGGSGVLGSAVRRVLGEEGCACDGTTSSPGVEGLLQLDLRDAQHIASFFGSREYEVVINAAATGVTRGSASPSDMAKVNDRGAGDLAEALARVPHPPLLVHLASATEPRAGGVPESLYAKSKADGTARVRAINQRLGSPTTIVKLHNVYASQRVPGRLISDLLDAAIQRREVHLRFPNRVRDFCFLDEVASRIASLVVGDQPVMPEMEVGTAQGVTIAAAAHAVFDAVGSSVDLIGMSQEQTADPNPCEVADPTDPGLIRCSTLLAAGLAQVLRRRP